MTVALFCPARSVSAQAAQSATDPPSTIDEAIAAYEQGRLVQARALFLAAHEQQPNARTLRGLGVVSYALGEYVEALAYLDASLRHPVRPLSDELRALVTRLIEDSRQHVGCLRFEGLLQGMSVRVDDLPVALDAEQSVYVAPGEHSISVRTADREVLATSQSVLAGETALVTLTDERSAASAAPDVPVQSVLAASAEQTTTPIPSARPRLARAGMASVLVGIGLVGAGAPTFFVSRERHQDVEAVCQAGCTPTRVDELYDARRIDPLRRAGVALSVVGFVALVPGVVLLVRERDEGNSSVLVGPSTVSFRHRF